MSTLILTPTPLEQQKLHSLGVSAEVCGFGLVASAARTSRLLADHAPSRAMLIGIAGGFGSAIPVGAASKFTRVACDGIGAGSGENHLSASSLGWDHYADESVGTLGDELALHDPSGETAHLLLTVAAASANKTDVARRETIHPSAIAEDMEGFSVAMACRLANIPLMIVRGISNQVGDRDHDNWRIDAALESAAALLLQERAREE